MLILDNNYYLNMSNQLTASLCFWYTVKTHAINYSNIANFTKYSLK